MQLVAIIEDVITEIGYWIKAIAVGDNDVSSGGESGNRHFFMSIPYIRVIILSILILNMNRKIVTIKRYPLDRWLRLVIYMNFLMMNCYLYLRFWIARLYYLYQGYFFKAIFQYQRVSVVPFFTTFRTMTSSGLHGFN